MFFPVLLEDDCFRLATNTTMGWFFIGFCCRWYIGLLGRWMPVVLDLSDWAATRVTAAVADFQPVKYQVVPV